MLTTQCYDTELDKELQKLAQEDWAGFVALIGENNYTSAKICILRKRGKSLKHIAIKLRKTIKTVRYAASNKCVCISTSVPLEGMNSK
jgi:hypothetical protein